MQNFDEQQFKEYAIQLCLLGFLEPLRTMLSRAEVLVGREKVQDLLNEYLAPERKATALINATYRGNMEICSLLIKDYEVNLESPGYVLSLYDIVYTPLIAAIRRDHIDIVELLIRAGANINVPETGCRENPLRSACRARNVKMIELLFSYGVDFGIANRGFRSCLAEAAEEGFTEIVTCLLKHGANPDTPHKDGTPLESASFGGYVSILQELARYGANLRSRNSNGLTPILTAAERGHVQAVEYFLNFGIYNREEMVNAMELLGASVDNNRRSFRYLKRAFIERSREPVLIKPKVDPMPAYQLRIECQTLRELEILKRDEIAFEYQKMIIRSRILCSPEEEAVSHIFRKAKGFADKARYRESIDLLMNAPSPFEKLPEELRDPNRGLLCIVFGAMLKEGLDIPTSPFLCVLESTASQAEKAESEQGPFESRDEFVHSSLYLTYITARLLSFDSKLPKQYKTQLYRAVTRLIRSGIGSNQGESLLHSAVSNFAGDELTNGGELFRFPDFPTVRLLIDCGADVNAVTKRIGYTPIHYLVRDTLLELGEMASTYSSILTVFIKAGAYFYGTNYRGCLPSDIASPAIEDLYISSIPFVSLKYLAALVVDQHVPNYETKISSALADFVKRHSLKRIYIEDSEFYRHRTVPRDLSDLPRLGM